MLLVRRHLLQVQLQVLFILRKTLAALNLMMSQTSGLFLNHKGTLQRAEISLQRRQLIVMDRMLFHIKQQSHKLYGELPLANQQLLTQNKNRLHRAT